MSLGISDPKKMKEVEETIRMAAEVERAKGDSKQLEPIGGATIDPRQDWEKWPRKVEIYSGDIPLGQGQKRMSRFQLSRACNVPGKNNKQCGEPLIAQRVLNSHFVHDKIGEGLDKDGPGGTLDYDFADYRYYVYCAIHGPKPPGPQRW